MGDEKSGSAISGAVGQAACGIVHDLSNLLQTILLRAEVTMTTEPVSPTCAKRLEQIVEDGKLSADLIRSLLEYARKVVDSLSPVDLVPYLSPLAVSGKVAVELPPEPLQVRADPIQIAELLGIIISGLTEDAGESTRIELKFGRASEADEDAKAALWMDDSAWVAMTITRDGPGGVLELEEGSLPKFGDRPELTERQMRMLRARGIVREHRGQIHVWEAVEDNSQRYKIGIFWPGLS